MEYQEELAFYKSNPKAYIQMQRDKFRNQLSNQRAEKLKQAGLDIKDFTPDQIEHIFQPSDAPENFYHDGEIDPDMAVRLWMRYLLESGLDAAVVKKLATMMFVK